VLDSRPGEILHRRQGLALGADQQPEVVTNQASFHGRLVEELELGLGVDVEGFSQAVEEGGGLFT
jgi:hypothetical protein